MKDDATTLAPHRPPPGCEVELRLRAAALAGRSVRELAAALGCGVPEDSRRAKGFVGQLVERALGADPLAGDRPDFPALGVELKTIPVDGRGLPIESTFCCGISMAHADTAHWENSRLRARLACVLWVPVAAPRDAPVGERKFGVPRLWRPDAATEAALRADWEELMGAIGAGQGGSLSARRGRLLQVRPKAAHARVRTLGPGPDGPVAMLPLGFYLRPGFTRAILSLA